ncbi:MAG: hypothetical protein JW821_01340 [Deltaproteobacteria bacterium]|nr:hypothetical protein [Deltaproteobacteria bacterium]
MKRNAFLLVLFLAGACALFRLPDRPRDYSALVEWIRVQDREGPLVAFSDYESIYEEESHRAFLDYFNSNPDLVRRIREGLDGGELHWRLDGIKHRFLFVPEQREEYADLYKGYCQDAVDYVLDRTKLDNPYACIRILREENPELGGEGEGITAFLVHNLARETVASYVFSCLDRGERLIKLTSREFIGEVGSYASDIHLKDDGTFFFSRDRYTIWQDSAENPYTALMVPVEETLHIALRAPTERAIRRSLKKCAKKTPKRVERIAEEWIAVEEAVVGGCVRVLMPDILDRYVGAMPVDLIAEDLEVKEGMGKYRHLRSGIALVEILGCEEAVSLYKEDPEAFRRRLLEDAGNSSAREEIRG